MNCPFCDAENDDSVENCFRCGKGLYAVTEGTVLSGRYEILSRWARAAWAWSTARTTASSTRRSPSRCCAPTSPRSARHGAALPLRDQAGAQGAPPQRVRASTSTARTASSATSSWSSCDGVDLAPRSASTGACRRREAFDVALQIAERPAGHPRGRHRPPRPEDAEHHASTSKGVVRLMDFGIAKRSTPTGDPGTTAPATMVGTPEYMSPEQARGDTGRLPQRHLRAGHRDLRAVHRRGAVPRRDADGHHPQAPPRAAAAARPGGLPPARLRAPHPRSRAGQGPHGALLVCARAVRRAAGRRRNGARSRSCWRTRTRRRRSGRCRKPTPR